MGKRQIIHSIERAREHHAAQVHLNVLKMWHLFVLLDQWFELTQHAVQFVDIGDHAPTNLSRGTEKKKKNCLQITQKLASLKEMHTLDLAMDKPISRIQCRLPQ